MRAGRSQKGMYLTVADDGVRVFDGTKFYKDYLLKDLASWGSVGEYEDSPTEEHNLLTLTKVKDGNSAEFITDPGDSHEITLEIGAKAGKLAKKMQRAERKFKQTASNTERQGFDAAELGLPALPEGQRYYKAAKVLRGKDLKESMKGVASLSKSSLRTVAQGGKENL